MPVAELRGQRLHYSDSGGSGMPLVLGHGFLMDGDMFEHQVEALTDRHRVITWDQRGHGRTVSTAEAFSYWDSADDLAALLDHLGVERAVIGGMSQGGFVRAPICTALSGTDSGTRPYRHAGRHRRPRKGAPVRPDA